MNKLKKSTIYKVLTWFSITLFFEILFSIIMKTSFSIKSVIHIGIYSFILAIILTLLTNRTGTKKDSILVKIILFLYGFLFAFQCVFYRIFKVYFSIYNLEISDQVTSFTI